jgi:uncharacterized protein YkwD
MQNIFLIVFLFLAYFAHSQDGYKAQACVNDEEYRLYQLINQYRADHGLPAIELSASLCLVAGAHVWDLQMNHPDQGRCNMHSWSDSGPWSACCYTEDHKRAQCVWSKPEEISGYDDYGYEVAYYSSWSVEDHSDMAAAALEGWKGSPGHDQIIRNRYSWKRMKWRSMGVGMFGNYVVVWFGEKTDSAGKARRCRQ